MRWTTTPAEPDPQLRLAGGGPINGSFSLLACSRRDGKIRFAGDRVNLEIQGQGKTDQRAVIIKLGQWLSPKTNMPRGKESFEQRFQRLPGFKEDFGSARGYGRNQAHELDRIAEALLGIEQDPLSSDWFTLPLRLCPGALLVSTEGRRVPTMLILLPAFLEVAGIEQNHRPVYMEFRRFGRHLESTVIAGECVFVLAEVLIDVAEVGPCIAMVKIELRSAQKAWKGFLMPAYHIERSAQIVMKEAPGRLEARRVLITGNRIGDRFERDKEIT